jgi:peptidoglycan/xylan/chitin deacetylase (PgdA/CDA1 family)
VERGFVDQQLPILMYHSISNQASAAFRSFAVPPRHFAEQMAYLHMHGYTPLTVSQLVTLRTEGPERLPTRPVVITFDDGFADFATEALPILKRYQFAATLYVTTGFVNETSRWLLHEGEGQRPMLSWEQLREVSENGIECGAHTHTHPQLDMVSLSQVCQEIIQSKDLLEQHLSKTVKSFAYPYGYYTPEVRALISEVGYRSACAVRFEMSTLATDSLALARLKVSANTEIHDFAALLEGRNTSPLASLYTRARTPAWRVVRRCFSAVSSYFSV